MRLLKAFGMADAASDAAAQIADLNKQIDDLNSHKAYLADQYANHGHFGGKSPSDMQGYYDADNAKIAALQSKINTIQSNVANTAAAEASKSATVQAAQAANPAAIAQAEQDAANSYKKSILLISQPGYDYGIGSDRRNKLFAGLGALPRARRKRGTMTPQKTSHSLYNLYRRDGLNDIFSDILAGVKGGIAADKAAGLSPSAPSLPSLSLPGFPSVSAPSLPSWLTTFVKGGVKAGVASANAPAPNSPNIATGGAARVMPAERPAPNYLAWGAAAAAVGAAAWALKGRSRK